MNKIIAEKMKITDEKEDYERKPYTQNRTYGGSYNKEQGTQARPNYSEKNTENYGKSYGTYEKRSYGGYQEKSKENYGEAGSYGTYGGNSIKKNYDQGYSKTRWDSNQFQYKHDEFPEL